MPRYKIVDVVKTYCETIIEADTQDEALDKANADDCDWSYDTDYDESLSFTITELKDE